LAATYRTFTDQVTADRGIDVTRNLPCAQVEPSRVDQVFHPTGKRLSEVDISEAQQICGGCPVSLDCFGWAWDNKESGVWGGMMFNRGNPLQPAESSSRKRKLARTA